MLVIFFFLDSFVFVYGETGGNPWFVYIESFRGEIECSKNKHGNQPLSDMRDVTVDFSKIHRLI